MIKKMLEVQDQRAAKQRARRGIKKHGGEAVFKHWATEEKSFRRVTDTKARLGGIKCWKMREEFSGIDSTFKGFREEEKTRDRAIILEIWRVKIKLPDNKQSEMNQFWKYMLMQCGRSGGGGGGGGGRRRRRRQSGLSVLPQMTWYQTTGFWKYWIVQSDSFSLPAALYLCTDHIRGCTRSFPPAGCHFIHAKKIVRDQ